MKPVVGIICEYDPFHIGHARQFSLLREILPGATILCLMSGPFTQRGMPAIYAPAQRARAALNAGADIVVELPTLFAVREAEHFALGGVDILHRLGFVTHLSFGCETNHLETLQSIAYLLEAPTSTYLETLKNELANGASYPSAQGHAIVQTLGGEKGNIACKPNNILAITYLRALMRLKSPLIPLPVLRKGSYHSASLHTPGYPSATAIRSSLLSGHWSKADVACGYSLPRTHLHLPHSLDPVLLHILRSMGKESLRQLPGCIEGLENRLYDACRNVTSRQDLLTALKTKRYPYARLNRLCTHALLSITNQLQQEHPSSSYVRLLGFRKDSKPLLSRIKQSPLPIVSKAADGPLHSTSFQLDIQSYDLWALGAGEPAGLLFRQKIQVIPDISDI